MPTNFEKPIDQRMLRAFQSDGHIRPWAELEREVLDHAIEANGGSLTRAAAALKIARSTLYRYSQDRGRDA
jgi:DNA-binding NtrC family response regulator